MTRALTPERFFRHLNERETTTMGRGVMKAVLALAVAASALLTRCQSGALDHFRFIAVAK